MTLLRCEWCLLQLTADDPDIRSKLASECGKSPFSRLHVFGNVTVTVPDTIPENILKAS